MRPASIALSLALMLLTACGSDSSSGGRSNRQAVESAARSYIVDEQSDEQDSEQPSSLSFPRVDLSGDSAKVEAKSSATGNRYKVDLSKSGNSWRGTAVLTDRPPSSAQSGDPARGSGQTASTDQVETQIEQRLLKLVRIEGQAQCPPRIKIRRGNDFTCKVVGSNRPATVQVTQKDDQGNLGYKVRTGTSP